MRKIDELGRIVIPKDIRSAMNLKVGDFVDISACGDYISVVKTSELFGMEKVAEEIARAFEEELGGVCVISDLSKVVAVSNGRMRYLIGSELTNSALDILENMRAEKGGERDLFSLSVDLPIRAVCPIAENGLKLGIVAIFGENGNADLDVSVVKLLANVLGKLK